MQDFRAPGYKRNQPGHPCFEPQIRPNTASERTTTDYISIGSPERDNFQARDETTKQDSFVTAPVRAEKVFLQPAAIHVGRRFVLTAAIPLVRTIARASVVQPGAVLFPVGISFHRWPRASRASPGGNALQRLAAKSTTQQQFGCTALPLRDSVSLRLSRCLRHRSEHLGGRTPRSANQPGDVADHLTAATAA